MSGIRGKYPILGICYGAQFISYSNGGRVEPAGTREYVRAHLDSFDSENVLFKGVRKNTQVWMSHGAVSYTHLVDYLAYMLKYDTMHGQFDGTIEADVENSELIVNGQAIRILSLIHI